MDVNIDSRSVIEIDLGTVTENLDKLKSGTYIAYINKYWVYNHYTNCILFYTFNRIQVIDVNSVDDIVPQCNSGEMLQHHVIKRIYTGLSVKFIPMAIVHIGMFNDKTFHLPTPRYKDYLEKLMRLGHA